MLRSDSDDSMGVDFDGIADNFKEARRQEDWEVWQEHY